MAPVYAWLFGASTGKILVLVFLALLVIWRHRENIRRLLSGAETKIELSRKPR